MSKKNVDILAYRERRGVKLVTLQLVPEDLAIFDAYAAKLGLPRATMIRRCVARCMEEDGFAMPDSADKKTTALDEQSESC